jgi:hypothetical protein
MLRCLMHDISFISAANLRRFCTRRDVREHVRARACLKILATLSGTNIVSCKVGAQSLSYFYHLSLRLDDTLREATVSVRQK